MGQPTDARPSLLVLAAFSQRTEALEWAATTAAQAWGPIAETSPRFAFDQTDYYESTMGDALLKQLMAFERPIDPAALSEFKRQTNAWERTYADTADAAVARPLNLDPGYVTPAKLVLASTKDHAHRIYLGDGIYAEVTLSYRHKAWQAHPWTFPDYRQESYHAFLNEVRRRAVAL